MRRAPESVCINPKQRVEILLKEGAKLTCDETNKNISKFGELPEWYDEEKYKRGQQFFRDYIFVLFLCKFCGLLVVLAIPSILDILIHTGMSGRALTAYKRYTATILHMCIWYKDGYRPSKDSDLWKSIGDVRTRHMSASNKGCKAGFGRITQRDMALTQFGFMGFVLTNRKLLSLENVSKEDLEGFIHIWRVVGYLLGIEDRFNICAGNLEETTEICERLTTHVFQPSLKNLSSDLMQMSKVLVDGMIVFQPFLEHGAFVSFIFRLCGISFKDTTNNNVSGIKITSYSKCILWLVEWELYLYQFYLVRLYFNLRQTVSLWLLEYFPFIAFYKFGYGNSYVTTIKS